MATATINGTEIRYEDTGGEGTAILLSHGFLMDHTMFDDQVAALAAEYRCIRWDERGFGSTRAPGDFTYWDSADDAIGLLDHLDIDRAVLVGMSQGGFLSLRAALAHPDRVRALVLIDSSTRRPMSTMPRPSRATKACFTCSGTARTRSGRQSFRWSPG